MSTIPPEMTGRRVGSGIRLLAWKHCASDLDNCTKTLDRRRQSDPDFPEVIWISGRKYLIENSFAEYKRILIRRALSQPNVPAKPAAERARGPPI
jgi:hypothetical protein